MAVVHAWLRVLAGPLWSRRIHGSLRVAWIVLHVMVRSVRRVLLLVGIGRARRGGDGWIYRYVGVRFKLLLLVMIICLTI